MHANRNSFLLSSKICLLSSNSESFHITLKPAFNQAENHIGIHFKIGDVMNTQ